MKISDEIPIATLATESFMTNPPKPMSIGVRAEGRLIAIVPLDEFERAWAAYNEARKMRW